MTLGRNFLVEALLLGGFAMVAAACLVAENWRKVRVGAALQRWAASHGYQVIRWERSQKMFGPYFWSIGAQQVVEVVLEDKHGARRHAWGRCGGALVGLWSDRVEIKLDKNSQGQGFPVIANPSPHQNEAGPRRSGQ